MKCVYMETDRRKIKKCAMNYTDSKKLRFFNVFETSMNRKTSPIKRLVFPLHACPSCWFISLQKSHVTTVSTIDIIVILFYKFPIHDGQIPNQEPFRVECIFPFLGACKCSAEKCYIYNHCSSFNYNGFKYVFLFSSTSVLPQVIQGCCQR